MNGLLFIALIETQLTERHNHTELEFIDQNQTQIIIIISALMNGLLLILLIGVTSLVFTLVLHLNITRTYHIQRFSNIKDHLIKGPLAGPIILVTVEGFIGGYVVLPCSSDEHDVKLQDINVLWRDKDSETIYDIINGKDSVAGQNPCLCHVSQEKKISGLLIEGTNQQKKKETKQLNKKMKEHKHSQTGERY
ncbi:hypothetical protein cypCar_00031725 [Cyprinus carpio]|nr:hypothetical protein cypCar_00031725 [Cyprinus carpio]